MLQQISDYVFMGSLGLFVITVIIFFSGSGGESNYINAANSTGVQAITGSTLTDLQMNHDHKKNGKPTAISREKIPEIIPVLDFSYWTDRFGSSL